ncbi:M1 family metallopeptidase [Nocardioides dongxiaopingii]|uniref:M1 family metallopeptidase n=1 Tax=Nocardioides dongxiaopingii TaxID=2576036 RepID=UPI0010C76654|nr:M1 family metallopeptidase [Nocardioides dongxiaopingii]
MTKPRPRSTRISARLLTPLVAIAAVALPAAAPAHAEDPVAGAQTSGDSLFPHVGNGGYDVQHYDLDIAWTPGATLALSTIAATTSIEASTTGAPLSSFSLDFERGGLTVSSVTVNGVPAAFAHDEVPADIKHKLVVTPATPVSGAFTTVVTYSGIPTRHTDADGSYEGWNVTADGATFVNQPIGSMTGFPNNNTPADKATYTIDVDIPTTIANAAGTGAAAAASNGELVGKDVAGDRTTWRWVQQEPMASELAIISIGKYDVLESDVTLASGRTLHEWSFVDSASSTANKNSVGVQRARFKSVIDGLESRFGPYPGNSIGVVVDLVPSAISYALETQDRSFFPTSINAGTFVHELAHQWYGNNVAPTVWNDLYINEGMATWMPTHFANQLAEPATSGASTEYTYFTSWSASAPESANWLTPPAGITDAAGLYGYQTYTRSAQFWEALRLSIGDADFFALIREWQVRHAGQSRGTAALLALAEEVSGAELDAFFQDWVRDADKPAWPQRYDLVLGQDTADGALEPGDTVTYTVTAANRGYVPLTSSVAEVDLSDVLDDATLGALPDGLTLAGDTLTWALPTTPRHGSRTASFDVVVDGDVSAASLRASLSSQTLGGFCAPGASCTTRADVAEQAVAPAPLPTITGTPKVGSELTADTTGWAPGTTFAFGWTVGGEDVADATGPTLLLGPDDAGKVVRVTVTGSKAGYGDVTRTSAATAAVAAGDLTATPTPTVTGTARVGVPLTAVAGTWDDGVTLAYRWTRDGAPITGATAATYTAVAADAGRRLGVVVTGTKPGFAPTEVTSADTAPVALGQQVRRPTPTVAGRAAVGRTLRAVPGARDAGVTLTYRWFVGGKAVAGARGAGRTFAVTRAARGKRVVVVVTATRPGYVTVTGRSPRTAKVV